MHLFLLQHLRYAATPQAKARVESSLVLEAIVKAEKIEATDEEFDEEVKKMAERYGIGKLIRLMNYYQMMIRTTLRQTSVLRRQQSLL